MGFGWKLTAAAVILAGSLAGPVYASQMETQAGEEWIEDYEFDEEDLEALEGLTDEELEQMAEEYFENMPDPEALASEAVLNPSLSAGYNSSQGMYLYQLPNGDQFRSTVPRGGLVRSKVVFEPVEGSFCTLNVDGKAESMTGRREFVQPGSYLIRMICSSQSANVSDFNIYQVEFFFRILPEEVSDLSVVTAPQGYEIRQVRLDGRQMAADSQKTVFLNRDGLYQISFRSAEAGFPEYSLSFRRDTQAPCLLFSKDINEKDLSGPLTYRSTEPDSTVKVVYKGVTLDGERDTIQDGGGYNLIVTDSCGNSRIYHVVLRTTYRFFDKRLIIIAIIALGALAVYLFHARKDMRVL